MSESLNLELPISGLLVNYVSDQIFQVRNSLSELLMLAEEKEPGSETFADLLHDLRVASRRILSVVHACEEFLPVMLSPDVVWPYQYLLKSTARLRDLDVLCINLNTMFSSQLPDSTNDIIKKLFSDMAKKRLKAWNRFSDKLNKDKSAQNTRFALEFVAKSENLLKQSHENLLVNNGAAYNRIKDVSAVILYKSASKITSYGSVLNNYQPKAVKLTGVSEDTLLSSKDLHKLRLAFKEFRYNIEMFSLVYPSPVNSIMDTVKRMQDALGTWHDMEFAFRIIERWTRKYEYELEIVNKVKTLATSEKKMVIQMWYQCKVSELQSGVGEWLQLNRQII